MKLISKLIEEHSSLVEALDPFSFPETMRLIGALGTIPELHANTLRIELLAHLAATQCRGRSLPATSEIKEWIGPLLEDSPLTRMEDPPEDVFIGCINSPYGSFRVFTGIFAEGYFWVERLLRFASERNDFPGFQEAINASLQLLRLSDAVAEKLGLTRYFVGGGTPGGTTFEIDPDALKIHSDAVTFSRQQLIAYGLDEDTLENFVIDESDLRLLTDSRLWNSALERKPMILTNNDLILVLPSSLCRALVHFLVGAITKMGAWGDNLYAIDSASTFVNDVAQALGIRPTDTEHPKPPAGLPALFPFFGEFDHGKPALLLTYVPELEPVLEDLDGFDCFTDDQTAAFDQYLKDCCAAFEETPGFNSGLVLAAMSGAGRGFGFSVPDLGPQWTIHVASLNDWLTLISDPDCNALRLWRLGQHEQSLKKHGIKLFNPSGLLNLYAHWQNANFSLIPRELDLTRPHNLLVLASDFGRGFRARAKQQEDEHCVRSHEDNRWVRLRRNTRTINPDRSETPIYGDIDLVRNGHLLGCGERNVTLWWVEAQPITRHRTHLFELWECVLNWVYKSVPLIQHTFSGFHPRSVLLSLILPNFENWACHQGQRAEGPNQLSVKANPETQTIKLVIPEGFLNEFNEADNVAERKLVKSFFQGVAYLACQQLSSDTLDALVLETVKPGARYFHITEARGVEQIVAEPGRPDPQFVQKEDSALLEIGLADLVGRPAGLTKITGLKEAKRFLHGIVTKIWERIEDRLVNLNHRSVISMCFAALDEVSCDELRWMLSTRALLTLDEDEPFAQSEIRSRLSKLAIASLANRLIIETSQYACKTKNGSVISHADHGVLLAEFELLLRMAAHHDAIGNGFMDPGVTIHPNGKVEVAGSFYENVFSPYLTKRTDDTIAEAYERYEKFFLETEGSTSGEAAKLALELKSFRMAFSAEFGFPFEALFELASTFEELAVSRRETCTFIHERELVGLLTKRLHLTRGQAGTILERFSLPLRRAWDRELPPRCSTSDVFPWRYRRGLSLYARPLVQLSMTPNSWMISASHLRKAIRYTLERYEQGHFPERHFQSGEMKSYVGVVAHKKGHEFVEKVTAAMRGAGLSAQVEVKMSRLGAPASPDLGDVDVLAWDVRLGKVFVVECKRLIPAVTVTEAAQRLEEFKGDPVELDRLAKHLRRIDWLRQNSDGIVAVTIIPTSRLKLVPLLVTSDLVPMQFLKEVNFPAEQFVDFARLHQRLAG